MTRARFGAVLFACGATWLAASSAHAGPLFDATWTQVTQGFPMSRTGGQLGITGNSTSSAIAATAAYPQTTIQFFVPKTPNGVIDLAVTITQGGAQALTATAGMATANTGVMGTVLVMTALHAGMNVNQSMYAVGGNTILAVPLSIGRNGQFISTFLVLGITHEITVNFYGWTPGTLAFSGLTSRSTFVATPTVTAMGSFDLTQYGGGTVTLVSTSLVSIDCALAQRRAASFTTLTLHFVPEPGTLLLAAAAALGLALSVRRC